MDKDLVIEVPQSDLAVDEVRRLYRLTMEGRSVLSAEIGKLESVVREARLRLGKKGIQRT